MTTDDLLPKLDAALQVRPLPGAEQRDTAQRLFAGFYEGCPSLVADRYGRTLVLFDYGKPPRGSDILTQAQDFYLKRLPWLTCVIQKRRHTADPQARRGVITFGEAPAQQIVEQGVWYALDLRLNQDASFYLDTRHLRAWLRENAAGWRVLNTFAYTGSLGVAALAGGARQVIQSDRSKKFLALARQSAMRSRLDLGRMKLHAADFFTEVARLKRSGDLFDCVILDPPFFSSTDRGRVDLLRESTRLINKVRPLIADGGCLVAINNSLFLSGADYLASLEALCADGYLSIERRIPVPREITGFPETAAGGPPVDPAPFNHPTKIAVLRVRRKGG